jgi:DNA-binding response OmpR family regulator
LKLNFIDKFCSVLIQVNELSFKPKLGNQTMRLLLVEDDELLAETLGQILSKSGFAVDTVSSVKLAISMGLQEQYGIALLDMGLPDGEGLQALNHWRKNGCTFPVLILTARNAWQYKVDGLKAGADDYLTKPFHNEELLARIQAVIRRTQGRTQSNIVVGDYVLDEDRQRINTPDKEWHSLTGTEFRLLRCLMGRPGQLFSKKLLIEQLYGLNDEAEHNTIEVYIRRLRRIIGREAINTHRGQGYVFNEK